MVSRDLVFHNFWWKVTALLLAVIVWFVVKAGDLTATAGNQLATARTQSFPEHPLLLIRAATDQRPIHIEPTQVLVEVTGAPLEMAALRETDIQAFVDISEVGSNGKAPIHVYLPPRLRLERLEPKEASVQLVPTKSP